MPAALALDGKAVTDRLAQVVSLVAAYPEDVWQVSNSDGWILGYIIAEQLSAAAVIDAVDAEK